MKEFLRKLALKAAITFFHRYLLSMYKWNLHAATLLSFRAYIASFDLIEGKSLKYKSNLASAVMKDLLKGIPGSPWAGKLQTNSDLQEEDINRLTSHCLDNESDGIADVCLISAYFNEFHTRFKFLDDPSYHTNYITCLDKAKEFNLDAKPLSDTDFSNLKKS